MFAMKADVYGLGGEKKRPVELGRAFSVPLREDVIRRAFLAESSRARTPYGSDPLAGKRTSAHYHGKRHYRFTMMNREMARMKRIHGQGFLNYTARFVPQAAKGRRAHPPKAGKKWEQKINRKERMLALLSAISATTQNSKTFIIEDSFEGLNKSRDVAGVLGKLGIVARAKRKVRAGRGKSRGRKYRKPRGALIIVSKSAVPKLPGTEVVLLRDLSVSDLAPGGVPGRACLWTESCVKEVEGLVK